MLTDISPIPQVRTLKVYDKVFCRGGRFQFDVQYTVVYPEIRLLGKWLQDCGFKPGQQIQVQTEQNRIIITPV